MTGAPRVDGTIILVNEGGLISMGIDNEAVPMGAIVDDGAATGARRKTMNVGSRRVKGVAVKGVPTGNAGGIIVIIGIMAMATGFIAATTTRAWRAGVRAGAGVGGIAIAIGRRLAAYVLAIRGVDVDGGVGISVFTGRLGRGFKRRDRDTGKERGLMGVLLVKWNAHRGLIGSRRAWRG